MPSMLWTTLSPTFSVLLHHSFRPHVVKRSAVLRVAVAAAVLGPWIFAAGQTKPSTVTTLTLTSNGSTVTTVTSGTVITLTASVHAGATSITTGQVDFCDAAVKYCTDIHLLGMAQLTSAGKATIKLRPGNGSRSFKAVFRGTKNAAPSFSATSALTVSSIRPTTTSIVQTGIEGDYTLTATTAGVVNGPGMPAPTGTISFVDTSANNSVLATAGVASGTPGFSLLDAGSLKLTQQATVVATADFNGDGFPDLAVSDANYGGKLLAILLGKADGTFTQTATSPTVGTDISSIAVGDFNSDGNADLAISSMNGSKVTILLGVGDGTFTTAPDVLTANLALDVVAGDFNGDGIEDLATVNGNVVLISLGKGDGTFTAAPVSPSFGSSVYSAGVGDFNGDGNTDLAVTGDGSVTILLGHGDGTFTSAPVTPPVSNYTTAIAVGDFNGDGFEDLATLGGLGVLISAGNGDGTFKHAVSVGPVPASFRSLLVADFNADGVADLAGAEFDGPVSILTGNGDGTFTTAPALFVYSGSGYLAAADFNGDGNPDLAVPSGDGTLAIQLSQPAQIVTATVSGISPVGPGPHQVIAKYPGDSVFTASVSDPVALPVQVAAPVITPASGSYTTVQTLTITDATPGATIFYYAVGAIQTSGWVPYTGPITLSGQGPLDVEAYATASGYDTSSYVYVSITVYLPPSSPPMISLPSGGYAGTQTVTISAPGSTIYYTTNGSWPSATSTKYTGPISVSTSETLVATALTYGYSMSTPVSAQYVISSSTAPLIYSIAGNGSNGYSGDGGSATLANLNNASSSALDAAGNLYVADSYNNVIRKIAAGTGVITTFAGIGTPGYSGDNGPAISASFNNPFSLAFDSTGNLYVADTSNNVIRKIAATTHIVTTVTGTGTAGFGGDGGPATSATLNSPMGVAIDSSNNLYIADGFNSSIRKVSASSKVITTVAGIQGYGYSGDGGPATAAELNYPHGVAVDGAGNLFIADFGNNVIRKVTASTGLISTVAGVWHTAGSSGYSGDGGPATSAQMFWPWDVAVDTSGNLFISDMQNSVVRKVTGSTGIITTFAGNGDLSCFGVGGDGGAAASAGLCYPAGLTLDTKGNLYIADRSSSRIRVVTAPSTPPTAQAAAPKFSVSPGIYPGQQTISITDSTPGAAIYITMDGSPVSTAKYGYNGPINVASSVTIQAIAAAPGYLTSTPVTAAYTITSSPATVITTIAGSGTSGFTGAGGPATSARFKSAAGTVVDSAGNLFFSDVDNNVVWMVSAQTKIISIAAGSGIPGYIGDGGPAPSARLNRPIGLALDSLGNLYIADSFNCLVRKVDVKTGLIATVAGSYGSCSSGTIPGHIGDGGPATSASLMIPAGVALDHAGNLYISDTGHYVVREVSASTGIITTIAGSGVPSDSGDGGPATSATFNEPSALAMDSADNVFVVDTWSGRIRKIAAATGIITTVAGNGNRYGTSGEGGPATSAEISPGYIAFDAADNLFLSDGNVVRKVEKSTGIITRVVGNGYPSYSGDGGSPIVAGIYWPTGIAFDAAGSLYIADYGNYRIRKVAVPTAAPAPVFSLPAGTYTGAQTVTVTDATAGATIYYTADGTTPTVASNAYTGPITVSSTQTLKAIATAIGYIQSAVTAATYTIQLPQAPSMTVTPSSTSVTTAQALTVTVVVTGASGQAVPTGTVTLNSGSYNAVQTLASGSTTFNLAAGVLPTGANTLTAVYAPDASSSGAYTSTTQSAAVTVTAAIGTVLPSITAVPSASTITDKQDVNVSVSVAGANGQPTPTGSVSLVYGSFSTQRPLTSGAATLTIPAGTLTSGANSVTINYSGDATFSLASTSTTITVSPVIITVPAPATVSAGGNATGAVTLSSGSTYSGTMNLTCALVASPAGAQSLPTCSLSPTTLNLAAGGNGSSTLTVQTKAATSAALTSPLLWLRGGGIAFAAILFIGLPAKRRPWMSCLGLFSLVLFFGAIGCGGGGSPSQPPPTGTPATTAGTYTFNVVGTDAANSKIATTGSVTITVR